MADDPKVVGEKDWINRTDSSMINVAMSLAFSVIWLVINYCLAKLASMGYDELKGIVISMKVMVILAVCLCIVCFMSFRLLRSFFKQSESVWFYLTVILTDLVYLTLAEVLIHILSKRF